MASTARTKAPEPATAPVVAPDKAWEAIVISQLDAALAAEHALRNDRTAREDFYERELQRLTEKRDAELASIDAQVKQQLTILDSCDAALEHLMATKPANVVPLKPKAEDPPIPGFLTADPIDMSKVKVGAMR